ncbi:MAG: DUF5615 family PIN-like protein [Gemmataceae bacterium]
MAALYADENFPHPIVDELVRRGHDVLTAQADGRAHQGIDDPDVLARAIALGRAVVTEDRDYITLHKRDPNHAGIVYASADLDFPAEATRIDAALAGTPNLTGRLIRVYLPPKP